MHEKPSILLWIELFVLWLVPHYASLTKKASEVRALFVLLVFLLIPATGEAVELSRGTHTSLQIQRINVPSFPRHGQTSGQTRLMLRSEPDSEIIFSKEYEGNWFCIGFNANIKAYILGGIFERGAWLPLGSIQYLRENGSSLGPSAFDRLGYLAMTAVTSHSGRYVVFIGGQDTTGTLYVLDVERDTIKRLGSAPAPPPNALAKDVCSSEPFEWGTCWGDRYVETETGIIRFKPDDVLEVSYGHDSPNARAKKRRVRQFKLGQPINPPASRSSGR